MRTLLAFGFYLAAGLFFLTYAINAVIWMRRRPFEDAFLSAKATPRIIALSAIDILLLARLFRANPGIWVGEWVFHVTFALVIIRHLKYFLNPIPGWIWSFQLPGLIAGYLLPLAMSYILVVKLFIIEKQYLSRYNLFLLALLILLSVSGLLMNTLFPADYVSVKNFILGILTFMPAPVPISILFLSHFAFFLLFVVCLPIHIFAAPLVIFEARRREEGLRKVMHEE